jgi:lysophospholipase L1-like esterase
MARRCGNNRCSYPRANWWKAALGVDFISGSGEPETTPLEGIKSIPTIFVPVGTAFGSINFSDYDLDEVTALGEDGEFVTCSITWAAGSYNSAAAATYTISGTLTPPDGYDNSNNLIPQISVTVIAIPAGYTSILNRTTALGGTHPTPICQGSEITLYNVISALSMDVFYNSMTDGSRHHARVNWKNPGTSDLTETGTLTYTSRKGFTGNGVDGFLNTNYNTSTATNFTLNACGMGAYFYDNTPVQIGSVNSGARIMLASGTRFFFYDINGNTVPSFADSYSGGWFHVYRTASGTVNYTKNSGLLASGVADNSVARPNANIYLLGRNNNGTPDSFSIGTISAFWAGAALNASVDALFAAWQAHLLRVRIKPTYGAVAEMGTLVNDSFARASLGVDYTTSGTATWSPDGSKLVSSGGAPTTYTNRLLYEYGQSSERCTISGVHQLGSVPSGTTGGIGMGFADYAGLNGERSIICKLDLTNGADAGKVKIITWNGSVAAEVAVASSAIGSIAQNNVFTLSVVKTLTGGQVVYTVTAVRSSDSAFSSVSYSTLIGDSTGDFALFNFGGTINTTNLTITLSDEENHRACIVGDSLSHGVATTSLDLGWARNVTESYQISAGSGDVTGDVLGSTSSSVGKMRNILDYNARYYLIAIGGNDVAGGVASGTWQAHLKAIANTIKNEGHKVIFVTPPPRNDGDLSAITTYTTATFSTDQTISQGWTACKGAGTGLNAAYNSGDNVHMNDAGHAAFAAAVEPELPILY